MNLPVERKKSLRETLSCPVCDKLPTPPVYGCQNGHIICESCIAKVHHCSICRSERFCVRNLIVEELLGSKILPCDNANAGCRQPLMTGLEFTLHMQNCSFRQIECDCKDDGCSCQSLLIPYSAYLNHLCEMHGAELAEMKSTHVRCDIDGSFTPRIFQCYNRTFILMSHRKQTRFWSWIASMDGESELFYYRLKLLYESPCPKFQPLSSDTLTVSSVRESAEDVLKGGQCLEFSVETLPVSAPPCVWPEYEAEEGEACIGWGYEMEIWQPSKNKPTSSVRAQTSSSRSTDDRRNTMTISPERQHVCSDNGWGDHSQPVLIPSADIRNHGEHDCHLPEEIPVLSIPPDMKEEEEDDDEEEEEDDDKEYFDDEYIPEYFQDLPADERQASSAYHDDRRKTIPPARQASMPPRENVAQFTTEAHFMPLQSTRTRDCPASDTGIPDKNCGQDVLEPSRKRCRFAYGTSASTEDSEEDKDAGSIESSRVKTQDEQLRLL